MGIKGQKNTGLGSGRNQLCKQSMKLLAEAGLGRAVRRLGG